jgi:hypothetical protein
MNNLNRNPQTPLTKNSRAPFGVHALACPAACNTDGGRQTPQRVPHNRTSYAFAIAGLMSTRIPPWPFPTFLGEIQAFPAFSRVEKNYLAKSQSEVTSELLNAMPPLRPLPQIETCEQVVAGSADRCISLHQQDNHLSIQAFSSLFKEKMNTHLRWRAASTFLESPCSHHHKTCLP